MNRGEGAVLLTGATGFVGMELLSRYIERSDRELYVLVRAPDDAAAQARLRDTMCSLYGSDAAPPGRVMAVAADIERERLGLGPAEVTELAERLRGNVPPGPPGSFSPPLGLLRGGERGGGRRPLGLAPQGAG